MIAGLWTYLIGPDFWWVILVKAVIVIVFLITPVPTSPWPRKGAQPGAASGRTGACAPARVR